jgi:hypothetical protein
MTKIAEEFHDYSLEDEIVDFINPYDQIRGSKNASERHKWQVEKLTNLVNSYPELREAYQDGDVRFCYYHTNTKKTKPYFRFEIAHSRITAWYKSGFLRKPDDQRGTETQYKLSTPRGHYWLKQHFDKLSGEEVNPYVFSTSSHWEDVYKTNGGHRVIYGVDFDNPHDTTGKHKIKFPFKYEILDVLKNEMIEYDFGPDDDGKLRVSNLRDIIRMVGNRNWKEFNSGYHPVDWHHFDDGLEKTARVNHSEVFGHSNTNLAQIQIIHSYYTDFNLWARPLSSWVGARDSTLLPSLVKVFGNGLDRNHANCVPGVYKTKSVTEQLYNKNIPYQVFQQSFMIFVQGYVDHSLNQVDLFNKSYKTDKDIQVKFIEHFDHTCEVFLQLRAKNAKGWDPKRLTQLFTLLLLTKDHTHNPKSQKFVSITEDKDLVEWLDKSQKLLINESNKSGGGYDTFIGARRSFTSTHYLQRFLNMWVQRLIHLDVFLLLDPNRNIKSSDKALASNTSWLTGKEIESDDQREFHHAYRGWIQGGVSSVGNCQPIEKTYNREISDRNTVQYIEDKIKTNPEMFTSEKLRFWNNGGMEILVRDSDDSRFSYYESVDWYENSKIHFYSDHYVKGSKLMRVKNGAKKINYYQMIDWIDDKQ